MKTRGAGGDRDLRLQRLLHSTATVPPEPELPKALQTGPDEHCCSKKKVMSTDGWPWVVGMAALFFLFILLFAFGRGFVLALVSLS
jgi:hypothetical protein